MSPSTGAESSREDERVGDQASVARDYATLTEAVGVVPLRRDVVRVSGPDALDYLQGQCSQDVAALEGGNSTDALLLTPQGKVDALVRVTEVEADVVLLDVDAGYGPAVLSRLERFRLRVKAAVEASDWEVVSLRGPQSAAAVDAGASAADGNVVVPYAWGAMTGVDVLGPRPSVPAGVRPCRLEAWEALRIEAGIPVMGAELDDRTIAAEAGLLERCVSFTKGCYTGQELVARLEARGNKVARRLRGLVLDTAVSPGVARRGAQVVASGRTVGRLTSVAWSPGLRAVVALAYVQRDVEPPRDVEILVGDGDDGSVRAQVRALPLVA